MKPYQEVVQSLSLSIVYVFNLCQFIVKLYLQGVQGLYSSTSALNYVVSSIIMLLKESIYREN